MPVTALNTVVLPAPFGPMTEKICPFSTTRSTPLTAVIPPNRIVSFRIVRTGIGAEGQSSEGRGQRAERDRRQNGAAGGPRLAGRFFSVLWPLTSVLWLSALGCFRPRGGL